VVDGEVGDDPRGLGALLALELGPRAREARADRDRCARMRLGAQQAQQRRQPPRAPREPRVGVREQALEHVVRGVHRP
jgi:hypothetical protein